MRNHGGRCKCGRRGCVSGVAQKIDATTIGQVVTSAQSLVTIVPDSTPLIVEATVNNQDIGYLKPGQAVEIKVDTFPFQKYGSLRGTLIWVSAEAEDKNAASSDLDTSSGAHATKEPQNQRTIKTRATSTRCTCAGNRCSSLSMARRDPFELV